MAILILRLNDSDVLKKNSIFLIRSSVITPQKFGIFFKKLKKLWDSIFKCKYFDWEQVSHGFYFCSNQYGINTDRKNKKIHVKKHSPKSQYFLFCSIFAIQFSVRERFAHHYFCIFWKNTIKTLKKYEETCVIPIPIQEKKLQSWK